METMTELNEYSASLALTPMDASPEAFKGALARRQDNRDTLIAWVRNNLKQGIDFDSIHTVGKNRCPFANQGNVQECNNPKHWSKPLLFKPGAEKICGMLGLKAIFPNLDKYEEAAYSGVDIRMIIIKCEILDPAGHVIGMGAGARSVEKDGGDMNKSMKMAMKSAHVDAVIRTGGLSEIFTQEGVPTDDSQDVPTPEYAYTPTQRPPPPTPANIKPLEEGRKLDLLTTIQEALDVNELRTAVENAYAAAKQAFDSEAMDAFRNAMKNRMRVFGMEVKE